MPTAAQRLTPKSTDREIANAISSCIQQLMREGGREQDQCIAICYSQASKATGKKIRRGR